METEKKVNEQSSEDCSEDVGDQEGTPVVTSANDVGHSDGIDFLDSGWWM